MALFLSLSFVIAWMYFSLLFFWIDGSINPISLHCLNCAMTIKLSYLIFYVRKWYKVICSDVSSVFWVSTSRMGGRPFSFNTPFLWNRLSAAYKCFYACYFLLWKSMWLLLCLFQNTLLFLYYFWCILSSLLKSCIPFTALFKFCFTLQSTLSCTCV